MLPAAVLVLCAVVSCGSAAQAGANTCTAATLDIVQRELRSADLSLQDGGNTVSAACKPWPYQANALLVALAYDAGVQDQRALLVALVDEKSKRVLSSRQSVIDEDAAVQVGPESLKLDTARYQLADGVRAFGVRFTSAARGPSCGDAYWNDELTLYLPQGAQLQPVLGLHTYRQQWIKGCPAATSKALWEDAQLTLRVAGTQSHGLRDLIVAAQISVNASGATPGARRNRTEHRRLRYDGTTYRNQAASAWWLGD